MRTVVKLPAYRRLLAAYTLNELAFSVGSLALAVLVYHRTGSAIGAMGFFLCAQAAPALFAPALVGRLDGGRLQVVLPALYGTEAVLFGALAALAHRSPVAVILVLAFADGTVALVARAIARAASVSVLNPVGLLEEGNALMNTLFSICFMLGPALGGVDRRGAGDRHRADRQRSAVRRDRAVARDQLGRCRGRSWRRGAPVVVE